ncbi:hypothetical protein C942_04153 [Photobacterium marinum]|uniref:Uncharacterized protein n=1 Tax=Photobacterium marinum TaxID=1056511 RepID=L8JC87_9GAMM|nr:DUF4017 family protein [Photobacterium marinum]ELR66455.1 hypothetical protein C942_04153 [Photobacterium marinum]
MKHIVILALNYFIIMILAFIVPGFVGYWLINWLVMLFFDVQ